MKPGQLSKAEIRDLRAAALAGDAAAARSLLAHSVALHHDRLSVRRYAVARLLGAEGLEEFRPFCSEVAADMPAAKLRSILTDLTNAHRSELDVDSLIDELSPASGSFRCSFAGVAPLLAGPLRFAGAGSAILGRLTLGTGAVIGAGAVIRADGHFVRIGNRFVLGRRATVHIAHDIFPTIVGDEVAVGSNAIVHACTVGDRCIIEADAIILDGSTVGDDVVLTRGSVVFPRSTLEAGHVYSGSPARMIRKAAPGETGSAYQRIHKDALRNSDARPASAHRAADNFIAPTAIVDGNVILAAEASVFFGCVLKSCANTISIGRNTNIQDNSRFLASSGDIVIGDDTTIGHNVSIASSQVGSQSLIGMGSVISAGTTVEDDVLLAAGSITDPGQKIESGWLWGGRPAAKLKPLDDAKRTMMRNTIGQYRGYAQQYWKATS